VTTVAFATFCYSGAAHRLHAPGQLARQVESNEYPFDQIIVVYQECQPSDCLPIELDHAAIIIRDIDTALMEAGICLDAPQYQSPTDKHHSWRVHVVNHVIAIRHIRADYVVFADSDCWMIHQPDSWVGRGIAALCDPQIFIVSPNDGEPGRLTQRMSQQMFMVRASDFFMADLNQPGWDGNTDIPGGPMPEYWAMLEGRMELYCRHTGRYRLVLTEAWRYWHFNRLTADGWYVE